MKMSEMIKYAVITPCGKYRTSLTRIWSDGPVALFFLLNPSIADSSIDDPTVRRCIAFSKREKCGGLEIRNLFSLRSTNPKELISSIDPYGPCQDLFKDLCKFTPIIIAWGSYGVFRNRGKWAIRELSKLSASLWCFGWTKNNQPRHPLYLRHDTPLILIGQNNTMTKE